MRIGNKSGGRKHGGGGVTSMGGGNMSEWGDNKGNICRGGKKEGEHFSDGGGAVPSMGGRGGGNRPKAS